MSNTLAEHFSPDYLTARTRFREAAAANGAHLEAHPLGGTGPDGTELTLDVARLGSPDAPKTLVISSGTHGVEGFFGSAVQHAFLGQRPTIEPGLRVLLLHAINPFGFAHLRRVNEDNIDLNRNFMNDPEGYQGCEPAYRALNGLLNPTSPPGGLDLFLPRAIVNIARHGFTALKEAVVQGQYEFNQGLFYGGKELAATGRLLKEKLPSWIEGSMKVIHLDLHTGMGAWGTYVLATADAVNEPHIPELQAAFGQDVVQALDPSGVLYTIRGVFGAWLKELVAPVPYYTLLAEFGTVSSLKVLQALRQENRAHHFGSPDDPATRRAKDNLREAFAPSSVQWRNTVIDKGLTLIRQATRALTDA